ncbi:MAG: hypothetical protein AUJ39_00960 [Parcubacteria group bacterium CG1_02_42_13]|nr:MAG: hypothetical protein AUJ39_00960 [Parcubacteria group bacterium CG1_02_42_13]
MTKFIKWLIIFVGGAIVLAFIISLIAAFKLTSDFKNIVDKIKPVDFETCAALGNPVMESYPRQCKSEGQTFAENVGNEVEKMDLVRLSTPRPNEIVKSPLAVEGEARGNWFFETSFPVKIWDITGKEIARGITQAQGEWMTEEFVPFKVTLEFETPAIKKGLLILEKDNPSGLPENADSLRIPVRF